MWIGTYLLSLYYYAVGGGMGLAEHLLFVMWYLNTCSDACNKPASSLKMQHFSKN